MTKPAAPIRARAGRALAPLVLALFALTATPAPPARAEVEIATTVRHEMGAPELPVTGDELRLDLQDAVAVALERNLSLVIQRYVRTQSLLRIAEALGIYDFDLQASFRESEDTSPVVTDLVDTGGQAQVTEVRAWSTSLARLFPLGGSASATFGNTRFETNDAFRFINPTFSQSFDLNYNQPLLRNFGRTVTEQSLIVARIGSALSREDFETQVQQVVQRVADTYWQLVEAREQLKVSQESLDLAEQLHEMNQIQVEVGTMAPLEVVQSEANVATRREEIISREAAVRDFEDELRRLLNLDLGPLWELPIVPTTDAEIPFVEIDADEAIATALAERNDIQRKRLEIQSSLVDERVARNQKLPSLDFDATYGFNGIGGDQRDNIGVVVVPGGFSDALNQILDRNFDGWTLQLSFAYPIRNRAAKARLAQAELTVAQDLAELRDLEQQTVTGVRQQVRAVRTAAQTIESARVSSRLERKNFEAEQKRYENGLSTSLRVVQIQERLSEARSREVAAIAAYRRSLTALYLATGELLERYGISLGADDEDYVEDDGRLPSFIEDDPYESPADDADPDEVD